VSCCVNRNKLFYLLLFKNRLFMEQVVADIGSQKEVLNYVKELNDLYKKEINISIKYDTFEIILNIIDEESFYNHIDRIEIHDFNDSHCRIAYLLKELINKDDYLNIMDFSDYMNVSRSTVNNDLRKTRKLLRKIQC
jgi:lichenan operon transcriptional antiterminator